MSYKEEYRKCNQFQLQQKAEWLDSSEWSAFCTFTCHYKLSLYYARQKMEKLFEYFVTIYGNRSELFWVAEPFSGPKAYHIHALVKIKESPDLLKDGIIKGWHTVAKPGGYKKHNLAHVQPYEHGKGAHYYVAKYLQRGDTDFDWFY